MKNDFPITLYEAYIQTQERIEELIKLKVQNSFKARARYEDLKNIEQMLETNKTVLNHLQTLLKAN